MPTKPTILIQLDPDRQASVFDRVVGVDAGADHVFSCRHVTLDQVQSLVHGAIFTRGPDELHRTAIFIGGEDVELGDQILAQVQSAFLGPLRVSVMVDANGSNTTAAAAVLTARKHVDLMGTVALVLAGTGPVGQRTTLLLAREGARVRLASRSLHRATDKADEVNQNLDNKITPVETSNDETTAAALAGAQVVIAAGAAGVRVLSESARTGNADGDLKVAIDLNAVPPLGIEGVEVTDKAQMRGGAACYGAIGVGGTKMKIHKAAITSMFEANDRVLDAQTIYELGKAL